MAPGRLEFLSELFGHRIMPVVGAAYAYELRQDDQVLSTGRLTMDDELAPAAR
jgi:hypothetical protein